MQCRTVGFVLYTRITLIKIKQLLSVGGLGHLSIVIAKDKAIQKVIGLFVEIEACDEKTFIVNKKLSALLYSSSIMFTQKTCLGIQFSSKHYFSHI